MAEESDVELAIGLMLAPVLIFGGPWLTLDTYGMLLSEPLGLPMLGYWHWFVLWSFIGVMNYTYVPKLKPAYEKKVPLAAMVGGRLGVLGFVWVPAWLLVNLEGI